MMNGNQKTANELLRHCDLAVTGDVQDVSYRAFVKKRAEQYGITGYVENRSDGSVFIEAEGGPYDVERFIVECRKGPKFANVGNVSVKEGDVVGYSRFEIRL